MKTHRLFDGLEHLLTFLITGGQAHESTVLEAFLDQAYANLCDSAGDPIAWPVNLADDDGYRASWIDEKAYRVGNQSDHPMQIE